tara:strand:+ start:189 stop:551 length:363 start_codon:yes stop_codon:yes gene_type:complete
MTQDHKEKFPLYSPWKCRDGSKAVIVQHLDDHMIVYHEDDGSTWYHNLDGTFEGNVHKHRDLIEPWKEPRTIDGWVNVYDNDNGERLHFGHVEDKESQAKSMATLHGAVKTIKISYTEGE